MARYLNNVLPAVALAFLGGCVSYPYSTSFSTCDNAAGVCYRGCEDYAGTPEYEECHADCDYSADRCFDSAYEPYRYSSYGSYGYSSPWYGQYGSYYPGSGYGYSFGYTDYYGYGGHRRHHDHGHDHGHDRGHGDTGSDHRGSEPPRGGSFADPNAGREFRDRLDEDTGGRTRMTPRQASPQSGGGSSGAASPQPPRASQPRPSSEPVGDSGASEPSPRAAPASRRQGSGHPGPRRATPRGKPDRQIE